MLTHRSWTMPLLWAFCLAAIIYALGTFAMFLHPAYGYPAKVHRWEPTIRASAYHEKLSTSDRLWLLSKEPGIIHRESGGNPLAGSPSGCYGLLQFGPGWKRHGGWYPGHHHADWRKCGRCSIYRVARVMKDGGRAAIRRHWRATIR